VSAKKLKGGAKSALPTDSTKQSSIDSTIAFYLDDFSRTLFPLKTNREIIERGESEIKEYIIKCLDDKENTYSFLPQRRAYAAKSGHAPQENSQTRSRSGILYL
jgi:hypothetical protein